MADPRDLAEDGAGLSMGIWVCRWVFRVGFGLMVEVMMAMMVMIVSLWAVLGRVSRVFGPDGPFHPWL